MEQLALPGIIIGLTQVIKDTGFIPNRFLPLMAALVGTVFGIIDNPTVAGALYGLSIGLVTTGAVSRVDEYIKK